MMLRLPPRSFAIFSPSMSISVSLCSTCKRLAAIGCCMTMLRHCSSPSSHSKKKKKKKKKKKTILSLSKNIFLIHIKKRDT
eukprot:NODE_18681_length_881_cov_8.193634.p4 GENE.NODE_18681_length_881_cov_8.193634~~NODE_18681_length_881_cov_8.193634.p4  ORF type:complete len:81 (+),score=31.23 NODE_18681_length_881_cov_8.193634:563-805(+)